MDNGALIISLDFEMMWGCHDWSTPEEYGKTNVENVRKVITKLIDVFSLHNVHATIATVGMIMCHNKEDLYEVSPTIKPNYDYLNVSPYKRGYIESISKQNQHLYFAPDIVELLYKTKGIEVGTHTFSHYFCWEKGQTVEQFDADLKAANNIAERYGINLKSIVFPKNNVSNEYLKMLPLNNISTYRGNPRRFFNHTNHGLLNLFYRIARTVDNYIPITDNIYSLDELQMSNGVLNIPASRFLRPYNHILSVIEPLRIKRICNEIKKAAKKNKIYHLWWHPHNFGSNIDKNFDILEQILECYSECSEKYKMQSLSMSELAKQYNTQQ